jgi:phosphate-selective porin OprO/OprP
VKQFNVPQLFYYGALNWWWNQYTRLQFNWIHTMIDNTGRGPSTMNTFASRCQIEF